MDLEDEEPWLRAKVSYLRMIIPLVENPRAVAGLQSLAVAMDKRIAALARRRLRPLDEEEAPGG